MTDAQAQHRTELRLALGMRGGVSLAVWIGGACAEIDELRRCGEVEGSYWSATLAMSPYDHVVVDVIAGASAGGLNGVLYAASQRYGFPLSAVRQLWLELGDLRRLVRNAPACGNGAGPPALSLLAGDCGFLHPLQASLSKLIGAGGSSSSTPPSSVDLRLAATHVDPIVRRVPSPVDETLVERRSAAQFHFRHLEGQAWLHSDLPTVAGPDDPRIGPIAWRLALAARASSSYPVAFEAAAVRARRRTTFSSAPDGDLGGCLPDMAGIFSDVGAAVGGAAPGPAPEPADFAVMDGGVLDNIPLGRALRAIAAVPATTPTRRMLVYVQPGTAEDADPGTDATATFDARRSTVSVIRGAIGALVAGETIAGDVAQLEAHNDSIERAVTMRLGTLAPVVGVGRAEPLGVVRAAQAAWGSYEPLRADFDARLVRSLLDDPLAALGGDPFPRTVGGRVISEDAWRSPIAHWQPSERERLVRELAGRFGARLGGDGGGDFDEARVVRAGVRPLVRTATLLLEWARHLEALGVADASTAKQALYRALLFVEHVVERPRRLAWVTRAAASAGATTADAWAPEAAAAVNRPLRVTADLAKGVVADLRAGGNASIEGFHAQTFAELGSVLQPVEPPEDEIEDLRDHLFTFLADVADGLRSAADAALEPGGDQTSGSTARCDATGDDAHQEPGALLDAALRGQPITVEVLAGLEVVCFPEFVAGLPGQRRIEFLRLAAGNRTPLAPSFTELRREAECKKLPWTPPRGSQDRVPSPDGIHVALKLAGNELKNFAAFLKPEWRANDWMWGRLDAVPTLVDLLITPEEMTRQLAGAATDEDAEEQVKTLVVGATDPTWRRWLTDNVWPQYETLVGGEVAVLRSGGPDPKVFAIRDALVARRQWEILAEELASPAVAEPDGPGDGPTPPVTPLPPEETVARVAAYTCGLETITDPKDRRHADVAAQASRVAADAIVANVALLSGGPDDGSAHLRERLAAGVATAVRFAGPIAAHALLAPDADQRGLLGLLRRPPTWLVAAPTGAAVGLGAFALRRSPAAAGATLAVVALAPASFALRKLRALAGTPGGRTLAAGDGDARVDCRGSAGLRTVPLGASGSD